MEKKDIYEHLANIYLDTTLKRPINLKKTTLPKRIIFISAVLVFCLAAAVIFLLARTRKPAFSQVSLVVLPGLQKINYAFDPVRKEAYAIDLKGLNLAGYRALGFSIRKDGYEAQAEVTIRVEILSTYKEKSEIYLAKIPSSWQEHLLALKDFKTISDWSDLKSLAFVIEEWNVQNKRGSVYIDNVRFVR